jgi:hypothetical protein
MTGLLRGLCPKTRVHYNREGNGSQELSLGKSGRGRRKAGVRVGIHHPACLVPPLQGSGRLLLGKVTQVFRPGLMFGGAPMALRTDVALAFAKAMAGSGHG